MKHLLLLSLIIFGSFFSFGQNNLKELSSMPKDEKGRFPFWRCATVEVAEALRAQNPKLPSQEEFESFIEKAKAQRKQQFSIQALEEQVYFIPVVVHIIHNGEAVGTGSNIPYAQVLSQIEVLNEDFRKKEGSRGHNDHPAGADSQIEFVLAEVGPDGEMLPEPGVHRVRNTDLGVSGALGPYDMDNTVKPATIWDPLRYLNMWTAELGGGLLGYAQFPVASGLDGLDLDGLATAAETDGVVMRYTTFGSSDKGDFNLYAPYDKGRVTTHEVGHFLGLRHIWGDGGCGVDDYCSDTPESDGPNYDCNTTYSSCGSEDMTQNYMNYSTDPCMSIFTLNQKERFMAVLEHSPRRKELLTSNVLARANFTADKTTIYRGQKVVFTDESVGDFNSRSWVFEGGEPGTSVLQNPEVVYPAAGVYSVTLRVQDANSVYEEVKESYITVLEPSGLPAVDFTAESNPAYTGHPLNFMDASDETVFSWNWVFEGGEPATSDLQHPLVTYQQTGTYAVSLTVTNANGSSIHTKEAFLEVVTGPVAVVTPALFKEPLLTGESVVKNLTIENAGDAALTYALSNDFEAGIVSFAAGEESGSIPAGESKSVAITFGTGSLNGGIYTGSVSIVTNDPRRELVEVPTELNITGIPAAEISHTELDFGNIRKGESKQQILTITNTGTDVLTLTPVLGSEYFSVDNAVINIDAKSAFELPVIYNPLVVGTHTASLLLETNDADNPQFSVSLSGTGSPAPEIVVTPAEFLVELLSGEVKTENLLLENVGGETLFYSLRAFNPAGNESRKESGIIQKGEIPAKGEKDVRVGDPVTLRTGNDGVDGFGYSWKDSKSANGPVFNWTDISSTGTTLYLGDDNATSVTLPFSFPFYGQEKSMVYVSSNGFLTFNYGGSASRYNTALPDLHFPNDLIAAYWVDLFPGNSVTWFGNEEHFIVQFTDVPTYSGSGVLSFQYILYPDGDIKLQYLSTTDGANAATIGIENADGTDGLLIAFNTLFVENELAVSITPEKAISFVPKSGSIQPGASVNVEVSFNAEDLNGGTWKKEIHLTTNDPLNELLIIPVTMEVTGVPKMEVSEEMLVFEEGIFTGETARRSLLIQNMGTDELLLNSLSVSAQVFSLSASEGTLQPGESLEILVNFNASEAGEFTDNLQIISNDPLAGSLSIPLQAVAYQPPLMQLSAESLQASLYTGEESALQTLTISNTGGYPLSVNFSARSASFAESTGKTAKRKVDFYAGKAKPAAAVAPSDSEGLLLPSRKSFSSSAAGEIVEETFPQFTDGTTGMAWINGGLYALDYYNGYLMKYDFAQQQAIQQFYVSYNPYGLTWDGEYLWVAQGNIAYAFSLSGENMGSFNLPSSTADFRGMAWDGQAFLVYDPFTHNQVQRVSETGEVLGTWSLPEGVYIDQMVVSGNTLWAIDLNSRVLNSLTLGADNILLDENHGYPFNENAYSLAVDEGGTLWVADWYTLFKLNLRSLRFPEWVITDVPDTEIVIAEGGQQSFNFNFKAQEGMPVGNFLQELSINSNDPLQPASNVSLAMEILNSVPESFFQPPGLEMAYKENHQLDLLDVFKDANTGDQLTFFARADNDKAILSLSNNLLNIEAVKGGESQVTVFAKDQHGAKSPEVTIPVVIVDPDNNAPKVTGSLATQTIETGKTGRLVLNDLFSDPDGDPLRFEVSRNTEEYLKSEVTNEHNLLFTGLKKGTTTYIIRAKDGRGGKAELSFQVLVNERPVVRVSIPDEILLIKTDTLWLKLSDYVADAEGSIPEFSVTTDKQEMLEITLAENSLRIVALQAGETNLTLTAKDNLGASAATSFKVLGHHPPQLKESLPAVTINLSESHSVNLFPYFTEADGEAVTYTVAFETTQLDAQIMGSVLDLTGKETGESMVKVVVKDSRGAEVQSEFQVNVVEVLALKPEKSMKVKLFPNPFEEELFIEIENEERGTFTIILQDPLGREVKRKDLEKAGFKLEASLPLPGLSPGTYFLTISGNNGNSFHKVLKR